MISDTTDQDRNRIYPWRDARSSPPRSVPYRAGSLPFSVFFGLLAYLKRLYGFHFFLRVPSTTPIFCRLNRHYWSKFPYSQYTASLTRLVPVADEMGRTRSLIAERCCISILGKSRVAFVNCKWTDVSAGVLKDGAVQSLLHDEHEVSQFNHQSDCVRDSQYRHGICGRFWCDPSRLESPSSWSGTW